MEVSARTDAFSKSINIVHSENMLDIDMGSTCPYRTPPWYYAITSVYSIRNHGVLNKLTVAQHLKKIPLLTNTKFDHSIH